MQPSRETVSFLSVMDQGPGGHSHEAANILFKKERKEMPPSIITISYGECSHAPTPTIRVRHTQPAVVNKWSKINRIYRK